jgi:hypothetical protein
MFKRSETNPFIFSSLPQKAKEMVMHIKFEQCKRGGNTTSHECLIPICARPCTVLEYLLRQLGTAAVVLTTAAASHSWANPKGKHVQVLQLAIGILTQGTRVGLQP